MLKDKRQENPPGSTGTSRSRVLPRPIGAGVTTSHDVACDPPRVTRCGIAGATRTAGQEGLAAVSIRVSDGVVAGPFLQGEPHAPHGESRDRHVGQLRRRHRVWAGCSEQHGLLRSTDLRRSDVRQQARWRAWCREARDQLRPELYTRNDAELAGMAQARAALIDAVDRGQPDSAGRVRSRGEKRRPSPYPADACAGHQRALRCMGEHAPNQPARRYPSDKPPGRSPPDESSRRYPSDKPPGRSPPARISPSTPAPPTSPPTPAPNLPIDVRPHRTSPSTPARAMNLPVDARPTNLPVDARAHEPPGRRPPHEPPRRHPREPASRSPARHRHGGCFSNQLFTEQLAVSVAHTFGATAAGR